MIVCKEAQHELPDCGKVMCCIYCPDKKECVDECDVCTGYCTSQVEMEETDLMKIQSTVPDALERITDIVIQMDKLKEQEELFRQELLKAMEQHGVKKFENDKVSFTYVPMSSRTSIDSAKLKKLYPDIAEECSKTSMVSPSIRIKVK